MNSELRKKFLHIVQQQKSDDRGVTIIELLIVMMTIGILSAIALPSVLNQASKAKQVEAKTYISTMNRAQQVYYLENFSFTNSIDSLELGLRNQTNNYDYIINISNNTFVTHNAVARDSSLRSYAGITYLQIVSATNTNALASIVCESSTIQIGSPQTATSSACPSGYEKLE